MINVIGDSIIYEFVYGSIVQDELITHRANSTRLSPGGAITAYNYCNMFFEKPQLISYMCDEYTLSKDIFLKTKNTPKITQYISNKNSKVFQCISDVHINNFDVYSLINEKVNHKSVSVLYDIGFGTLDSIETIISSLLKKACTVIAYSKKYMECRIANYLLIENEDFNGNWSSYKVDNLLILKNHRIYKLYSDKYCNGYEFMFDESYSSNSIDIPAIVCGMLAGGINSGMELIQCLEYINVVLNTKLNRLDYVCLNKEDICQHNKVITFKLEDADIDSDIIRSLIDKASEGNEVHVYTNREELLSILQNFHFIDKVFLSKPDINSSSLKHNIPSLVQ